MEKLLKKCDRASYKFFSCKVTERFLAWLVGLLLFTVIVSQVYHLITKGLLK